MMTTLKRMYWTLKDYWMMLLSALIFQAFHQGIVDDVVAVQNSVKKIKRSFMQRIGIKPKDQRGRDIITEDQSLGKQSSEGDSLHGKY